MSIANVRPSNLANIKRLANQLKKRDGIPHRRALDLAARSAGFERYEHARTSIGNRSARVFLTGYWEDRVRQRGVISAVALGHRQAAFAVMCRG